MPQIHSYPTPDLDTQRTLKVIGQASENSPYYSLTHDKMRESDSLRWAVIADWHLFEQFGRGGIQRARDGFRKIASFSPSLGVSCGDLNSLDGDDPVVDYPLFKECMEYSGCPWLNAVGNHEAWLFGTPTDEEVTARIQAFYDGISDFYTANNFEFGQIPYTDTTYTDEARLAYPGNAVYKAPPFRPQLYPQPGSGHQGGTVAVTPTALPEAEQARTLGYYAMYQKTTGVTHIILNTAWKDPNLPSTTNNYFRDDQKEWFEDEVLANLTSEDRIVLYMHHPSSKIRASKGLDAASSTWLHDLLVGFSGKVLAVFNGHFHADDHVEVDGINYVMLNNGDTNASRNYDWDSGVNSFALCSWNESTSVFTIDGYDGQTSYSFNIS